MERYLLLLAFTFVFFTITTTTFSESATDQRALVAFQNSITSDPYGLLSKNWTNNTSVCYWIGVSCGIKNKRVAALNISGFHLTGTIAPQLGNLTYLRYLDISSNNFGGFVPSELSNLRALKWINVGANSLTGEVPSWFGTLPQLQQLHIYNNTFSGRIPEEIGNSSSLEIINFNFNKLSSTIPHGIFNVSSMKQIRVKYNNLSGPLPNDICTNIPNLKELSLSYNQLSGHVPPNIHKCRDLEILSLSVNHFNGNIPSEIGSLSMLRELFLGFNDFKAGGIPASLENLSRLELLSMGGVPLTGGIPASLGNLSRLKIWGMPNASLTGRIPEQIGKLTSLKEIYLVDNYLTGSILPSMLNISTLAIISLGFNQLSGILPSDMGKSLLPNIEELYLHNNMLSGEIPSYIANASKLTYLSLYRNAFSGPVPNFDELRLLQALLIWGNQLIVEKSQTRELAFLSSLTNCRYLKILSIAQNQLNGILPTSIGNLSSSLQYFEASSCNIKGVIPSGIGNLSSLIKLNLHINQMTGSVPARMGNLKNLQELSLSDNQLQGYFPTHFCQMSNLYALWLSGNKFKGQIPECLDELKFLRHVDLSSNMLNSTLPSNFWNHRDLLTLNLSSNYLSGSLSSQIGEMKVISRLDLSSNQFFGDIPSTFDSCESLEYIFLSNNQFEGSIPESLGNIRGLIALDLSRNYLSGLIPKSLQDLRFLSNFNVSCNKLEGEIPNGGRFVNFTAQSFIHNSGLCGEARFEVPRCSEEHRASRAKSLIHFIKYIVPSFISAIILAILAFVHIRRQKQKQKRTPIFTNTSLGIEWRRISYIELERATSFFNESSLVGRGSFGKVFIGTLSDGLNVAVKVFNLQLEGAIKSFETEAQILGTIRHRNLIRIIGCCSNTEFKALILAYMPNGSLEKWLYSNTCCLDLVQRLTIAIDVALALEYLHHGHTFPIVHCDIKPSNVLLDEDMAAHVGDFGISKLFDNGEFMIQTKTLATVGYAPPEYGMEGKVSTSGDVYSYGIMLLEMFTGKKPTDDMFGGEISLKEWVKDAIEKNAIIEDLTPDFLSREEQHIAAEEQCLLSIFELAMKCLVVSPEERINMIEAGVVLHKVKASVDTDTMDIGYRR